jgi:DNA-3-methyladenine glycosylase I
MASPDTFTGADGLPRCPWCRSTAAYQRYHDEEWGFPVTDDRRLFEKLCLEGFQAGLSWLTILNKREAFRRGFAGFDAEQLARFGEPEVARLLADTGIVRHRGKIESTLNNARRVLVLRQEFGSLAAYAWSFEVAPHPDGDATHAGTHAATHAATKPATEDADEHAAIPAASAPVPRSTSPESLAMSKDLKRRGWTIVGPTTVYAFMQAMGLVNDHAPGCHACERARQARAAMAPPRPVQR